MTCLFFHLVDADPLFADPPFQIAGTLIGVVEVKDGDGLLFGEVELRLQGIAAPEDRRGKVDDGGKEATTALKALAQGRTVVCYLDGTTANRRPVGVCEVDGRDIGQAMVRGGWARDCPAYSKGRYKASEMQARSSGRNLSLIYALPTYC